MVFFVTHVGYWKLINELLACAVIGGRVGGKGTGAAEPGNNANCTSNWSVTGDSSDLSKIVRKGDFNKKAYCLKIVLDTAR
jgi:hypothetical protein